MPTVELRNLIKDVLSDGRFQVYYDEAPDQATYPYVVFELSRGSAESFPLFAGFLEVNVWDRHKTYSRTDELMDVIEQKLRNQFYENDAVSFRCFDGDRSHIIDTNKDIKRTREKLMIRYSVKGE